MRTIRAVVFDLDGVLIDSEPVWERVRRALVTEYGGTYRDDATRAIMGMSAPEWSRYIRVELGVDLPEPRIDELVVAGLVESYERSLPLVPGALEAVRAIAACVPVAIASASNRALIDLVVDRAGIGDVMRVTVSAEEVGRGKPAPDVYLAAASRLGVEPVACGAVEDSSNGIRSARAAGMFVVAIPNHAFPPSREAVSLVGAELGTIAELTPETFGLTPVDRSRAKGSG